ncbi:MAG: preprotein translocase subunit SecE [Spirochaetales bacterium]|nr:preprotein translocase subunit SecE [Spirochaetales bacterium]
MNKIKAFLSETVVEMKKVVWPSWPSALSSMKVVIISTVIFAILFGLVDFLLLSGVYSLF